MKTKKIELDVDFIGGQTSLTKEEEKTISELLLLSDIRADLIYREDWRREATKHQVASFPGQGNKILTQEQKEIARLKKELHDAQIERDILKKAVSIFSRNDGKYSNS
jgi:transposase